MDYQDGFEIETKRPTAKVVLLAVRGEVDVCTSLGLMESIIEAFAEHPEVIAVDLSELRYMDSAGLGVLLQSARHIEDGGMRFAVDLALGPSAGAASAAERPASPAQRPRVDGRCPGAVAGRGRRAPDGSLRAGLSEADGVDGDAPQPPHPRYSQRERRTHRSGGRGDRGLSHNAHRPAHGDIVIQASGEIDITNSLAFRERLFGELDGGAALVVLDLDAADRIDTTGMSVILELAKRCRGEDRELAIVCWEGRVRHAIAATGLDQMIATHATLDEALGWTSRPRSHASAYCAPVPHRSTKPVATPRVAREPGHKEDPRQVVTTLLPCLSRPLLVALHPHAPRACEPRRASRESNVQAPLLPTLDHPRVHTLHDLVQVLEEAASEGVAPELIHSRQV